MEQTLGGPYMPVAILPEKNKILLAKMESRLPLEIFEEVLRAATDSCYQVRRYLKMQNGRLVWKSISPWTDYVESRSGACALS